MRQMGSRATCRAGWWPARRRPAGWCGRNRTQHHRAGEQFPGPAVQPAERHRGEIRRRDLLHRPLDRGGGARRDRPGLAGVYRISADRGTLTLLVDDLVAPNGIAFSPDEKVLYVNDSARRNIRAFDVAPNGTLARQTDRVFADLGGPEPGVPDGLKVDTAGNVFCGGGGGIYILDSKGKKLGRIVHGFANTANIAFGGDDWKTVYFCTRTSLGSFKVKIAGVPVPVAMKS